MLLLLLLQGNRSLVLLQQLLLVLLCHAVHGLRAAAVEMAARHALTAIIRPQVKAARAGNAAVTS
jgi:hypothetical protein